MVDMKASTCVFISCTSPSVHTVNARYADALHVSYTCMRSESRSVFHRLFIMPSIAVPSTCNTMLQMWHALMPSGPVQHLGAQSAEDMYVWTWHANKERDAEGQIYMQTASVIAALGDLLVHLLEESWV